MYRLIEILKTVSVVLLCAIAAGCDSTIWKGVEALFQGDRVHPDDRYLSSEVARTSSFQLASDSDVESQNSANGQLNMGAWQRVTTIGELDGTFEQTFGKIEDVDIDDSGRIYVLDSHNRELRVFSPSGTFSWSIGAPGSGPGEFIRPLSMVVGENGEVFVGDANFKVHRFTRTHNARLEYENSFTVEVEPVDMCAMNQALFIHGISPSNRNVIHVYDYHGNRKTSFGKIYNSSNYAVDYAMSKGKVACVDNTETVVFLPEFLFGGTRAYRSDGTAVWQTTITDYQTVSIVEDGNGSVTLEIPEDGMHTVASLVSLESPMVLVQVAHVKYNPTWRSEESLDDLICILVDSRDGRATRQTCQLERIATWDPSVAVGMRTDPYPRLSLYRFERDERMLVRR